MQPNNKMEDHLAKKLGPALFDFEIIYFQNRTKHFNTVARLLPYLNLHKILISSK